MTKRLGIRDVQRPGQVVNASYESREGFMRARVRMERFLETRIGVDSESSEMIRRADEQLGLIL